MQIVIDIPNEEVPNRQEIIAVNLHFIAGEVCECSYPYIVLPKGHGRLIDATALLMDFAFANNKSAGECVHDAPTIIEADKAESEGQDAISN